MSNKYLFLIIWHDYIRLQDLLILSGVKDTVHQKTGQAQSTVVNIDRYICDAYRLCLHCICDIFMIVCKLLHLE